MGLCASLGRMSPIAHCRQLRRLPHALLAVLLLTVAQTALIPCAMAYDAVAGAAQSAAKMDAAMSDAAMPSMKEHCAYCAPDAATPADVDINACVFPHAPTVDVFAASAHHVDTILSNPLLHAATFDAISPRDARPFVPHTNLVLPPSRPLTLTHCVQLK